MMHPVIVKRVVFPLHEFLKGKRTHVRLRELERTQWLDPGALSELQFERMRRHLEFAYSKVPYYTRLLNEHDLQPGRITSFADFARIPFLTKDIIRAHFHDLQPRIRLRGVKRMSTGGSTGVPVTILVDAERAAFTDAARLRAHRWFGTDVGVREIVLWASPIEVTRQDWVRALRDRLINSRLLSAFDLGEPSLARYANLVMRYRPQKLYGYASALYLLAGYLNRIGWTAPNDWPRVVFTTAEPLYDFQRAMIESVFNCPVSVEYGCRDGGLVATECPAGGLHIAAEGMLVETLRDEIILTNLDSFAMPIIRYRTGDVGTFQDTACPCGRGLPRLRNVEGRRTDFLITPSGKVMHALAVIYILREAPSVREFQVVQESPGHVQVKIISDGDFTAAAKDTIARRLQKLFEGRLALDIELTDRIERPPSGKHRYVISKVAASHLKQIISLR